MAWSDAARRAAAEARRRRRLVNVKSRFNRGSQKVLAHGTDTKEMNARARAVVAIRNTRRNLRLQTENYIKAGYQENPNYPTLKSRNAAARYSGFTARRPGQRR